MSKSLRRRQQYFVKRFNLEIYKNEEFTDIRRLSAELKYIIGKRGVRDIDELYKTLMALLENVEIQLAVAGVSGRGKSSFVNALRG